MVLRVRPTQTGLPTRIRYTPADFTVLHSPVMHEGRNFAVLWSLGFASWLLIRVCLSTWHAIWGYLPLNGNIPGDSFKGLILIVRCFRPIQVISFLNPINKPYRIWFIISKTCSVTDNCQLSVYHHFVSVGPTVTLEKNHHPSLLFLQIDAYSCILRKSVQVI